MSACSVRTNFVVAGFYAALETTSDPSIAAKAGQRFQSLSLTTGGLDCCHFNGPSAHSCPARPASGCVWVLGGYEDTQITANTRNAFPPGGLCRLRGKENKIGVSPGCQTRDVFRLGPVWHVQTNKEEDNMLRTWWCRCPVRHPTTAGACRENR